MKRLTLFALVPLAVSACAVGEPKPPTYVSDTGAVLTGNVYSNEGGATDYWWRYGPTTVYSSETTHFTALTTNDGQHPVSAPIAGLSSSTTYHWQLCVNDHEPDRNICSSDQTFTTKPAGGSSGIAFVSTRGVGSDIFVMDPDGTDQTNLTNTAGVLEDFPAWSPDGKRIVYSRGTELWTMNADGSGQTALTNTPAVIEQEPAWSPDGTKIAFHALAGGDREIFTINAADGSGQTQLTDNTSDDRSPAWSPDGGKLAFDSNRSGSSLIYLMSAGGANQTLFSLNPEAQTDPVWTYYRTSIAYTDQATGFTAITFDSVTEADTSGGADALTDGASGTANDSRASFSLLADPENSVGFAAFQRQGLLSANSEIFKGTDTPLPETNLTNNAAPDTYPAWSPRP